MKKRLYVLVIIASVLVNVAQPKERFVKAKDEIQQETEYIVSVWIIIHTQMYVLLIKVV